MTSDGEPAGGFNALLEELKDVYSRLEHVDPRLFLDSEDADGIARKLALPTQTLLEDALSIFEKLDSYFNVSARSDVPQWLRDNAKKFSIFTFAARLELQVLYPLLGDITSGNRREVLERCDIIRRKLSRLAGATLVQLESRGQHEKGEHSSLDETSESVFALRRLYAEFHRSLDSRQPDEDIRDKLDRVLQAVNTILAKVESEHMRISDLIRFLELQSRIRYWMAQKNSSAEGQRLWEKILEAAEEFRNISNRAALKRHDSELLDRLKQVLNEHDTRVHELPKLVASLHDLRGHDSELDDVISAMEQREIDDALAGRLEDCVARLQPDPTTGEMDIPEDLH